MADFKFWTLVAHFGISDVCRPFGFLHISGPFCILDTSGRF